MKNKKGFTIIELLIIVAIIGILATVIMIIINSARDKAKDNAALDTMNSIRASAQACIVDTTLPQNRLGVNTAAFTSICLYDPGAGLANAVSYNDWPVLSNNWVLPNGQNNLYCSLGSTDGASCASGFGSTCGYNNLTGKFCYRATNTTYVGKVIWCTETACYRGGF
jgi:prepilin-type N-terminal cleavage/methylation domain-containing protein